MIITLTRGANAGQRLDVPDAEARRLVERGEARVPAAELVRHLRGKRMTSAAAPTSMTISPR